MRTLCLVFGTLAIGACGAAAQEWCLDADDVYAVVDEGTITVYHDATLYNCCPEYFDFEVSQEEMVIRVRETEILEEPCDCLCCYNLAIAIEDVAPGDYLLAFMWFDYETAVWQEWLLEVTVPDEGQGGELVVGDVTNSGCVEAMDVPESGDPADHGDTWGRIKKLYR